MSESSSGRTPVPSEAGSRPPNRIDSSQDATLDWIRNTSVPLHIEEPGLPGADQVIGELSGLAEAEVNRIKITDRTKDSRIAVHRVYWNHMTEIQLLFQRVEAAPTRTPSRSLWNPRDNEITRFAKFQSRVLGPQDAHPRESRANILAILLSVEKQQHTNEWPQFLGDVWDSFLQYFVVGPVMTESETANDDSVGPLISDQDLPLDAAQISEFILVEQHRELFDRSQHFYCQLIPSRVTGPTFSAARDALERHLKRSARLKCRVQTQKEGSSEYHWYPERVLNEIYKVPAVKTEYETVALLLDDLYLGLYNDRTSRRFPSENNASYYQHLRDYLGKAQSDGFVRDFKNAVSLRPRLFTILVLTRAAFISSCWAAFAQGELTDEMLPLSRNLARVHFEEDLENFLAEQSACCSPVLRTEEQTHSEFTADTLLKCLPLLSRKFLAGGGGGDVFEVHVAGGYYKTKDCYLAMKVINEDERNSETEWHLAGKVFQQDRIMKAVTTPVASLRTSDKIFHFMPLASGNLHEYMTERHPDGPASFQRCRELVRWLHSLARAVEWLHRDVLGSLCIHGDLKTANVLYFSEEDDDDETLEVSSRTKLQFPLKIADFGISMMSYVTSEKQYIRKHELPTTTLKTALVLTRACANYPPEADQSQHVTERADIWAFGVMMCEVIAWIMGGSAAVTKLHNCRKGVDGGAPTLLSYEYREGRPQLKESINSFFNELIFEDAPTRVDATAAGAHQENATTHQDRKRIAGGLWLLVRDRLLQCAHIERAEATELAAALLAIYERGSTNATWSLPTRPSWGTVLSADETGTEDFKGLERRLGDHLKKGHATQAAEILRRMEGHTIEWKDHDGHNPLHLAVRLEDDEPLQVLLDHHDYMLDQVSSAGGRTVFHTCIDQNHSFAEAHLAALLAKPLGKPWQTDSNGYSPLKLLGSRKHTDKRERLAEMLLQRLPDSVRQRPLGDKKYCKRAFGENWEDYVCLRRFARQIARR